MLFTKFIWRMVSGGEVKESRDLSLLIGQFKSNPSLFVITFRTSYLICDFHHNALLSVVFSKPDSQYPRNNIYPKGDSTSSLLNNPRCSVSHSDSGTIRHTFSPSPNAKCLYSQRPQPAGPPLPTVIQPPQMRSSIV